VAAIAQFVNGGVAPEADVEAPEPVVLKAKEPGGINFSVLVFSIAQNKSITVEDIAEAFGMDEATVKGHIADAYLLSRTDSTLSSAIERVAKLFLKASQGKA
jgi:hypothetical protein